MTGYRIVARPERDILGEGPLWSPSRNCIFWVDILAPALRALNLATGAVSRWSMPEPIGWAVERKDREDLLVGLKSGFAALTLDPFALEPVGLWIAHWGGGRISRFHADGRLDRQIVLPAINITSIVFAGEGLDRMFVTSASMESADSRYDGALFEVSSDATGLASRRFAG